MELDGNLMELVDFGGFWRFWGGILAWISVLCGVCSQILVSAADVCFFWGILEGVF